MGKNFASISSQFRADFWDSGLIVGTRSQQESGQTKYEQKQACFAQGITSSHDVAKHTNIRVDTAKGYIQQLKKMGDFLKERGQCRDEKGHFSVSLITADHVSAYLSHKVEDNLAKAEAGEKMSQCRETLDNIASAINKWAACADISRSAGISESVGKAVGAFRENVLPDMPASPSRIKAYADPSAVIRELANCPGNINLNSRAALVAEIQLRVGLRVDNARSFVLLPNSAISIVSKGGMKHDKYQIPHDIYTRAVAFNGGNLGKCELLKYETYLGKLASACNRLKIDYHAHSSHGLRHNFSQNLYQDLIGKGYSDKRARAEVSEALFHKRLDVVSVYLKQ